MKREEMIPEGWKVLSLSELADINPPRSLEKGKEYPYIPMEALDTDFSEHQNGHCRIWKGSGGAKFQNGDVLLARITPSAENGKTAIADVGRTAKGFGSTELIVLAAKEGFSVSKYIFYLLKYDFVRQQAMNQMTGSTGRQRIPVDAFDTVQVFTPPLEQQRKIAAILSSLDDAIEKTQAVIDQLGVVKRGLMQMLFTRGVPGWQRESKRVKNLGSLPSRWNIRPLGDLAFLVTSGSRGWAKYYADEGASFIRIGNLTRDFIDIDSDDIQKLRLPPNVEGIRAKLQPNDLLISITADLGITNIVPQNIGEAYINQHVALVRLSSTEVIPRFAAYWLSYGIGQTQFTRLNDVGAKSGLNLSSIRAVKVALPPLNEQQKIINVLDKLDSRIESEQSKKSQLQTVKKGLMQGLLSGRMSVEGVAESGVNSG